MLLPNALVATALLSTLIAGIPIPNPEPVGAQWTKLQNVVLATEHTKPQPAVNPAVLSPTPAKTSQNADLSQAGKNWAKLKNVLTATKQTKPQQPAAPAARKNWAKLKNVLTADKQLKNVLTSTKQSKRQPATVLPKAPLARRITPPVTPKYSPESLEVAQTLFKLQLDKSKTGMSRQQKDKWLWKGAGEPIEKWPKNPSWKELFWPFGQKKPAAKPESPSGSPSGSSSGRLSISSSDSPPLSPLAAKPEALPVGPAHIAPPKFN
ncbi:hypothetical protein HYFRA_00006892 [Hymenoscyphus fraxineus]|uniref:Uncharacterized protein n=1 Tax=Hymenoscyphus fraxineus TaxID=746836 RepID=A0A9N9KMC4_9HELO|nr:hypothetical protein HYFRA_00006892 [Hymenoscyphus fraxineus]